MGKLLKIILLFAVMLSSEAYAANMGSVAKNVYSVVPVNESAKFTLLFWNTENESYDLNLQASAPDGWMVFIDPDSIVLNSSAGTEYVKLPYMDGLVRAVPVDVIAEPPYDAKPGTYSITVSASAKLSNEEISIFQEKVIDLFVKVDNPVYFEQNETKAVPMSSQVSGKEIAKPVLGSVQQSNDYAALTLLAVAIIVVISFLIYRYS